MQDCLGLVFVKLDSKDRLSCSRVCHLWRTAALKPSLWLDHEIIRLGFCVGSVVRLLGAAYDKEDVEHLRPIVLRVLQRGAFMDVLKSSLPAEFVSAKWDEVPIVEEQLNIPVWQRDTPDRRTLAGKIFDCIRDGLSHTYAMECLRRPTERDMAMLNRIQQQEHEARRAMEEARDKLRRVMKSKEELLQKSVVLHPLYMGIGRLLLRAGLEAARDRFMINHYLELGLKYVADVAKSVAEFAHNSGRINMIRKKDMEFVICGALASYHTLASEEDVPDHAYLDGLSSENQSSYAGNSEVESITEDYWSQDEEEGEEEEEEADGQADDGEEDKMESENDESASSSSSCYSTELQRAELDAVAREPLESRHRHLWFEFSGASRSEQRESGECIASADFAKFFVAVVFPAEVTLSIRASHYLHVMMESSLIAYIRKRIRLGAYDKLQVVKSHRYRRSDTRSSVWRRQIDTIMAQERALSVNVPPPVLLESVTCTRCSSANRFTKCGEMQCECGEYSGDLHQCARCSSWIHEDCCEICPCPKCSTSFCEECWNSRGCDRAFCNRDWN